MTETTTTSKKEAQILNAVYKNVKMATDSLLNLMPKVHDEALKSDMTVQLSTYEAFASRAAKKLGEFGVKPEEEGMMTKIGAKMGCMMNTIKDSTAGHLAEMIIEGATMGINDMYKQVREGKAADIDPDIIQLCEDLLRYEEKTVEQMKEYLK